MTDIYSSNYLLRYKKCPKVVKRHKQGTFILANQKWWREQVKIVEQRNKIPTSRRLSELKCIFTNSEIIALIDAGLKYVDDLVYLPKLKNRTQARRKFQSAVYVPMKKVVRHIKKNDSFFANLVTNYFKKTLSEARCWSPKKKPLPISNQIVTKKPAIFENNNLEEYFINWCKHIKSTCKINMDKDTIVNRFRIDNSLPIESHVFMNLVILGTVPAQLIKSIKGPLELSKNEAFIKEIFNDLNSWKLKPLSHAFGTMIQPPELRRYKSYTNNKCKYFGISKKHRALETFAFVFKDIMHLETTKLFLNWLHNHPEVKPPQYLKKFLPTKKILPIRRTTKQILAMYKANVWELYGVPRPESTTKIHSGKQSSTKFESNAMSGFSVKFIL